MENPWRKCLDSKCNRPLNSWENFCSNCGREVTQEQKDAFRYLNSLINKSVLIMLIPPVLLAPIPFFVLIFSGFKPLGRTLLIVMMVVEASAFIWLFVSPLFIVLKREKKVFRYYQEALKQKNSQTS